MNSWKAGLAALALAACGGDSATGPNADPYQAAAGTYQLSTYNGASVPQTTDPVGPPIIELLSGSMVLRANRSYTETVALRFVYSSEDVTVSNVENGTYVLAGTQITFTAVPSDGGFSYSGSISGNTLTYTFGGDTWVYQRL